jgi:hypothetical protein
VPASYFAASSLHGGGVHNFNLEIFYLTPYARKAKIQRFCFYFPVQRQETFAGTV